MDIILLLSYALLFIIWEEIFAIFSLAKNKSM